MPWPAEGSPAGWGEMVPTGGVMWPSASALGAACSGSSSRLASHADVATTLRYVKTSEEPLAELLEQPPIPRPSRWG